MLQPLHIGQRDRSEPRLQVRAVSQYQRFQIRMQMGQTFSVNICSIRNKLLKVDSLIEYFSKLGVDGTLGCAQAELSQLAQRFERPQGGGPNSYPRQIKAGQLRTIAADGPHDSGVQVFRERFVVYRDALKILTLACHHPIEKTRGYVFALGPAPILEVEMANDAMG